MSNTYVSDAEAIKIEAWAHYGEKAPRLMVNELLATRTALLEAIERLGKVNNLEDFARAEDDLYALAARIRKGEAND